MSVSTPAGPVPPATGRGSVLGRLTLTELRLFVREKAGPVFAVGLPLVLLVVFGNIPYYNQSRANFDGFTLLDLYVPILAALALATLSFNIVPAVLAGYREKGVLRRLRTTPVGPARVLAAHLLVSLATAAVAVAAVLLVARFAFGVPLPRQAAGYLARAQGQPRHQAPGQQLGPVRPGQHGRYGEGQEPGQHETEYLHHLAVLPAQQECGQGRGQRQDKPAGVHAGQQPDSGRAGLQIGRDGHQVHDHDRHHQEGSHPAAGAADHYLPGETVRFRQRNPDQNSGRSSIVMEIVLVRHPISVEVTHSSLG